MGSYPVAYRPGSQVYGSNAPLPKAFKGLGPYEVRQVSGPANQNRSVTERRDAHRRGAQILTDKKTAKSNRTANRPAGRRPYGQPRPQQYNAPSLAQQVQNPATRNNPAFWSRVYPKGLSRAALIPAKLAPWVSSFFFAWDILSNLKQPGAGAGEEYEGMLKPSLASLGWILDTDCLMPFAATHYRVYSSFCTSGASGATPCVTGQYSASSVPLATPMTLNRCTLLIQSNHKADLLGVPQYATLQYHYRPTASSPSTVGMRLVTPLVRPLNLPRYKVQPEPVADPHYLPIQGVMALPVPLPWAAGPGAPTDLPGRDAGNTAPGTPAATPITVRHQPPGPGTKEKKLRLPLAIRALQAGMHWTTEALDVLEVFHDALPKELQAKGQFHDGRWWNASPQAKADAIWTNFDSLDWQKVGMGLVLNELGDRILGRSNAAVDNWLKNSPIGRINRGIAF